MTALGLTLGGAGYLYSHAVGDGKADITFGNNAIQLKNNPFGYDGTAMTLGNTIAYYGDAKPKTIRKLYRSDDKLNLGYHERNHTYQAEYLGPLFLPIYFLSGGPSPKNWMEQGSNQSSRDSMMMEGSYFKHNPHMRQPLPSSKGQK